MTNIIPISFRSKTAAGGVAHVSPLSLIFALIVYQCIRPNSSRQERIVQLFRQGVNIDALTLDILVPVEIAGFIDELDPEDIGQAAAVLQTMRLGTNVVESYHLYMQQQEA